MPGGARRHCDCCEHAVYDLSSLTRAQAQGLLKKFGREGICVSYRPAPDGEPDFVPTHHLRARPSSGAALSLMLAACQTGPPNNEIHEKHPDGLVQQASTHPLKPTETKPGPLSRPSPSNAEASSPETSTSVTGKTVVSSERLPTSRQEDSTPQVKAPHSKTLEPVGDLPSRQPSGASPASEYRSPETEHPSTKQSRQVACLLNVPGCERTGRLTGKLDPSRGNESHLPPKPTLSDLKLMYSRVRPLAEACGEGHLSPGTKTKVRLQVEGKTGRLSSVAVLNRELPTAIITCISGAFKTQRLPRFQADHVGVTMQLRW